MSFTAPPLHHAKETPIPIERDAERTAETVWELWSREKSLTPSGESNPYSGRSPRSLDVPTQPGSISVISYFI